ncbi:hypothetical protein LdCL_310007900 [Leishmania donovani]|uniref:Uncharacterized protein n=1 Tax=Leishmania donovani TaxID=5661 RepID=A0A3S7X452_LEIDO|nr:hypothetical protein LdCL_310007900 [Leishmania donovani]
MRWARKGAIPPSHHLAQLLLLLQDTSADEHSYKLMLLKRAHSAHTRKQAWRRDLQCAPPLFCGAPTCTRLAWMVVTPAQQRRGLQRCVHRHVGLRFRPALRQRIHAELLSPLQRQLLRPEIGRVHARGGGACGVGHAAAQAEGHLVELPRVRERTLSAVQVFGAVGA